MRGNEDDRPWLRFGAFAASLALLLAGILVLKTLALPLVLRERWLLAVAFVTFLAFAWFARRATGALPAPSLVLAFVVTLVLVATLANTPLTYELRRYADEMPLPPGAETVDVGPGHVYVAGHPEVTVTARYAPGRNVTELTQTSITEFERGGWRVHAFILPNSDPAWGTVGFVDAGDAPFRATCTLTLDGALPTIRCTLRV